MNAEKLHREASPIGSLRGVSQSQNRLPEIAHLSGSLLALPRDALSGKPYWVHGYCDGHRRSAIPKSDPTLRLALEGVRKTRLREAVFGLLRKDLDSLAAGLAWDPRYRYDWGHQPSTAKSHSCCVAGCRLGPLPHRDDATNWARINLPHLPILISTSRGGLKTSDPLASDHENQRKRAGGERTSSSKFTNKSARIVEKQTTLLNYRKSPYRIQVNLDKTGLFGPGKLSSLPPAQDQLASSTRTVH